MGPETKFLSRIFFRDPIYYLDKGLKNLSRAIHTGKMQRLGQNQEVHVYKLKYTPGSTKTRC